jgi:hypothetical protein
LQTIELIGKSRYVFGMRTLLSTRARRIGILLAALCLGGLVIACRHWSVWTYDDLILYRRMRAHSPVAQALWRSEIPPGSSVDRVVSMASPHRSVTLGPFREVYYFPGGVPAPDIICLEGTVLIAKDGRLITAGSYGCTFQRTYFNIATPEESALYGRLIQAKIEANQREAASAAQPR